MKKIVYCLVAIAVMGLTLTIPGMANPSRCEQAGAISDQIDCYTRVIEECRSLYRKSKYAKQGGSERFRDALRGAKAMCEIGSAFISPALSGADQCLLNSSKALALYCTTSLQSADDPMPFAPVITNE